MPTKKKYLKEAAARARAAALAKRHATARKPSFASAENPTPHPNLRNLERSPSPSTRPSPSPEPPRPPSPIFIDFDSESECGYQGGVNHNITDDDDSHGDGSEGSDAGYETLSEFDDSDVKEMEKRGTTTRGSLYSQLQLYKPAKEWKKTEANRALGYNGHSSRTIRRQAMEARKRKEMRDMARTS